MLTAGTYTVEVTADDCEPLSKEITISADIATHTQAFELAYKSADYTELDKAEKAAKALNKDDYEDFSEVEKALAAIDRTKNITEQADVDAMVKAINDAVANLVKKAPASSQPDSVSSSASDSSSSDSKSDSSSKAASNTNPSTGVAGGAFALALLSGAAVVMAKKNK
ncbi:MAG: NPXTG-anchored protein [Ruminococcus bicirculans (ex Wegman et al. 2014)]